MSKSENLTDLLNSDPKAYELFYALPPEVQTTLRARDIRSYRELRSAAAAVSLDQRPPAF